MSLIMLQVKRGDTLLQMQHNRDDDNGNQFYKYP